jgi:hypothetical protein
LILVCSVVPRIPQSEESSDLQLHYESKFVFPAADQMLIRIGSEKGPTSRFGMARSSLPIARSGNGIHTKGNTGEPKRQRIVAFFMGCG